MGLLDLGFINPSSEDQQAAEFSALRSSIFNSLLGGQNDLLEQAESDTAPVATAPTAQSPVNFLTALGSALQGPQAVQALAARKQQTDLANAQFQQQTELANLTQEGYLQRRVQQREQLAAQLKARAEESIARLNSSEIELKANQSENAKNRAQRGRLANQGGGIKPNKFFDENVFPQMAGQMEDLQHLTAEQLVAKYGKPLNEQDPNVIRDRLIFGLDAMLDGYEIPEAQRSRILRRLLEAQRNLPDFAVPPAEDGSGRGKNSKLERIKGTPLWLRSEEERAYLRENGGDVGSRFMEIRDRVSNNQIDDTAEFYTNVLGRQQGTQAVANSAVEEMLDDFLGVGEAFISTEVPSLESNDGNKIPQAQGDFGQKMQGLADSGFFGGLGMLFGGKALEDVPKRKPEVGSEEFYNEMLLERNSLGSPLFESLNDAQSRIKMVDALRQIAPTKRR